MTTSKKKIDFTTDMKKVERLLKDIPEDRQPIAHNIYNELCFIQNTLDELKQQVAQDGAVTLFKQGKQEFLKEHPAMKSYNTTISRFSALYKQLIDILPEENEKQQDDPLMDFIKGD